MPTPLLLGGAHSAPAGGGRTASSIFCRVLPALGARPLQIKLITVSIVSEKLKIGGTLARIALKELAEKGQIRAVSYHSKQAIYTRATNVEEAKEKPVKKEKTVLCVPR